MSRPITASASFLLCLLTGCAGGLIEQKPAPVQYELRYRAPPVQVTGRFDRRVRVAMFSAAAPYDRTDMVVLRSGRRVESSSQYQWIAPPGRIVADKLARDLDASGLFSGVVGSTSPIAAPLLLSGRLTEFAWQRHDGEACAVLGVRVSLAEGGKEVLFDKAYHLESKAVSGGGSESFAAAMSGLVCRFSRRLARDLSNVAAKVARASTRRVAG